MADLKTLWSDGVLRLIDLMENSLELSKFFLIVAINKSSFLVLDNFTDVSNFVSLSGEIYSQNIQLYHDCIIRIECITYVQTVLYSLQTSENVRIGVRIWHTTINYPNRDTEILDWHRDRKFQISGFKIGIRDCNFSFWDLGLKFQLSGFVIRIMDPNLKYQDSRLKIRNSALGFEIKIIDFGIRDRD